MPSLNLSIINCCTCATTGSFLAAVAFLIPPSGSLISPVVTSPPPIALRKSSILKLAGRAGVTGAGVTGAVCSLIRFPVNLRLREEFCAVTSALGAGASAKILSTTS